MMLLRCPGSGARVSLSAVEADAREVDCRTCGRTVSVRVDRVGGSWPSARVPPHAPLTQAPENPVPARAFA
jgi:hypothetical protein